MPGQAPEIRKLRSQDAPSCDAIVGSLPYHFGDPHGRAACAEAVRTEPGLVAVDEGGVLLGFLTWAIHHDATAEITWLAVHAHHRRAGIGGALIDEWIATLPAAVTRLIVTTLAAESEPDPPPDGYQTTRRFYRRHGFEPIWQPAGYWNDENQALLMLRARSLD